MDERGGAAGVVHQNRDCHTRRFPWNHSGREAESCDVADVQGPRRHHRSISDLLGRRLFRSAQVVQIQPRMGSATRLWNLHLRRIGSDRYRQRDPRSAGGSHHGGLAGRDLCRR